MTMGELEEIAYQKAWDKEEKNMAKTYLPGMRKIHQTYADVCEWISGFALIFWLVFLIPARRRGEDIVNKTLLWLFVLLTTTWWFCTKPSWYFALQIPLMVYVGMYPMLYFRPFMLGQLNWSIQAPQHVRTVIRPRWVKTLSGVSPLNITLRIPVM